MGVYPLKSCSLVALAKAKAEAEVPRRRNPSHPELCPSTSSSCPSTPPNRTTIQRQNTMDGRSQSPYSQPSPADGASIIPLLKDKGVDDLKKLLIDRNAYDGVLHSIDQVKEQKALYNELLRETEDLARKNLVKEPVIQELKNQCTVIRTSELAAGQERFKELERQVREASSFCAPGVLLERLQGAAKSIDEESDDLHQDFINGKMELNEFITKYKKMRILYHIRSLLYLAAKCYIQAAAAIRYPFTASLDVVSEHL